MTIITTPAKLKNLVKDAIKEALALEFMKLRADLTPFVSDKEQKEIEKLYGKPARRNSHSSWNKNVSFILATH